MAKKRTPPAWLDANGKALFKKLAPRATDDNIESVQVLCQNWSDFRKAAAQLKKDGLVVVTSTGNYRKHPAFDIAKVSQESFTRLSKLLGLYDEVSDEINESSSLDDMLQ